MTDRHAISKGKRPGPRRRASDLPEVVREVVAAHWSTKFSGSLYKGLHTLTQRASVITFTEVGDKSDRRAIRAELGFRSFQGSGSLDECAIMWRSSYAALVEGLAVPVTTQAFKRGGGQVVKIRCATVVLQPYDLPGRDLWSVIHTVSSVKDKIGVQGRRVSTRSKRARVHLSAVRGHAKHVRDTAHRYKVARIRVAGDWNLPLQKARYRAYLKAAYATAGLRLHLEKHPQGTHGPARYDATLINRGWLGLWVKVLPIFKGHDHRAYLEALKARR